MSRERYASISDPVDVDQEHLLLVSVDRDRRAGVVTGADLEPNDPFGIIERPELGDRHVVVDQRELRIGSSGNEYSGSGSPSRSSSAASTVWFSCGISVGG